MMTLQDPEYRRLAIESSNLMLKYDGEWVQGNHEEASAAIWQAGQLRLQMGDRSRAAGDQSRALADYLSAASCFIKANDARWAEDSLRRVTQAGPIPQGRLDLLTASADRKRQLRRLQRRQQ